MNNSISFFKLTDLLNVNLRRQRYDGYFILEFNNQNIEKGLYFLPYKTETIGFILVKTGSLSLRVAGKQYLLNDESICFISPASVVELVSFSDDITADFIIISPEFIRNIGLLQFDYLPLDFLYKEHCNVFYIDNFFRDRMIHYIRHLNHLNCAEETIPLQNEMVRETIKLVNYEICSLIERCMYTPMIGHSQQNRLIVEFVSLVSKHFKENRSIQYYAEKLFISRKHLTKVVKTSTGITPRDLVDQKTIAEIILLMDFYHYTIDRVMVELNFTDKSAFGRFFKKHTGQSPYTYKKSTENTPINKNEKLMNHFQK